MGVIPLLGILGCSYFRDAETGIPAGPTNPLFEVIEKSRSLDAFIETLHLYPDMVNRGILLTHTDYPKWTILAFCASSQLTNHAVVLIEHGADVDEAILWLRQYSQRHKDLSNPRRGIELLESLKRQQENGQRVM